MKVTLTNPASFVNDASAVAQATANNVAIAAALENTLSRDGTGPNQMVAPIDMNSQRILNLPAPVSGLEPMRLIDGTNAAALAGSLAKQNNLSDLMNTTTARSNIGLGNVDNTSDVNKPVSTAQAAADAALKAGLVKGDVGLGNVDNTSDVNKPVSTAQASADATVASNAAAATALKANTASPTLTGVPAAPTAAQDTNTGQLATTAFVLAQAAAVLPLVEAGTGTVGTSTHFARADHVHPISTFIAPKVFVTPGFKLQMFGDSITVGLGASVQATYSYANRFAQVSQTNLTNYGVSGSASNRATKDAFTNLPAYQRRSNLTTWAASHNEVYRGGAGTKTISKTKGELRSFIANSFLASAVPINDASITKTGTWTNGGPVGSLNEKAATLAAGAGRLMFTTTVNDQLSGSFTGDNFVVGCFNADAVALHVGAFTVAIDGATSGTGFTTWNGDGLADGISDGVYNNQLTHETVVMTGLGVGSHTFVIKAIAPTGGSFPVYIDYVGTLLNAESAAPVIISENSRPNAAGYSIGGGIWSPSGFDTMDLAIHSVVSEGWLAGYPVSIARVSAFQNVVTDIGVDNEHPNDLGHLHLQQAFSEVISVRSNCFVPYTDLARSTTQSITNGAYNAVLWDVELFYDDNLHSLAANTSRITLPYAGTFRFEGTIGFVVNGTGIREAFLFKNGGQVKMIVSFPALAADDTVLPFFTKITGVAGDYFELMAIQNSGGPLNIKPDQTFLSVCPVR